MGLFQQKKMIFGHAFGAIESVVDIWMMTLWRDRHLNRRKENIKIASIPNELDMIPNVPHEMKPFW